MDISEARAMSRRWSEHIRRKSQATRLTDAFEFAETLTGVAQAAPGATPRDSTAAPTRIGEP